tara:strand:- start:305 stop:1174 length:870 start_codon:yes stop_codon:yes gene_type:complete
MPNQTSTSQPSDPKQIIAAELQEGLASSQLELPVMPRVASKIFPLTNDPNAEVGDLSQLIHSDQSIASHVLRIANSAIHGGGDQIVSLQQAVARLGMSLLGDIAIAVSLQGDLFKAPGFEAQITQLLRHALTSAAYGKEIARKRRRNVEGQFLCGLLHSVGKPIAVQLIARMATEKDLDLKKQHVAHLVGAFHRKIAAKVAVDWNLPEQLQTTTVYFKKYESAPSFKYESAATYLSQLLASWVINPANFNATELTQDPVFGYLNFYPDDAQDLLDKKDDVKAVVSAMEL